MLKTSTPPSDPCRADSQESAADRLRAAIDRAAHLLPAQGPINVFIHHNTLHAFEERSFLDGVRRGAEAFGCQPFLAEEWYRDALGRGRIRFAELEEALWERLGSQAYAPVPPRGTRLDLRLAMLQYPVRSGSAEELDWFMAETDALRRFRPEAAAAVRARTVAETRRWAMRTRRAGGEAEGWDDRDWEAFTLRSLWDVCRAGLVGVPANAPPTPGAVRHRDALLAATGTDCDPRVHDVLIRFAAAFLDQGLAHWLLPARDVGFFRAFCKLYRLPVGPPDRWLHGLPEELARYDDAGADPLDVVRETLTALDVPPDDWDAFLGDTLLVLRGWAGMVAQVEARADRVAHPVPDGSLVGYLAVRLLLDKYAAADVARTELGYTGPLAGLRTEARRQTPTPTPTTVGQRAFPVFQLAQVLGWTPDDLGRMTPAQWAELAGEVEGFSEADRREVFHLAYEARFRTQALDALCLKAKDDFGLMNDEWKTEPSSRKSSIINHQSSIPRFQVVTCLDEREESFRRHVEEIAPDAETFGAAGFFAVPMYYRGAADAHFVPLCPIVMRPQHWVAEVVDEAAEATHRRRAKARKVIGGATHTFRVGSRSVAAGAVLAAGFGVLASVPLVARILFPRLTARVRQRVGTVVETPPATRLKLERTDPTPGAENGHLGYTVAEMTDGAERLLRDIGLTAGFARLVFVLGHGSNSLNNPHKSAYDCGACGGSPGAPNGRAAAHILNDRRVRDRLAARGVAVPAETWFVGGFHNTCNDSVTWFDADRVPETHRAEFAAARADIESACDRNAHERCRRFLSAPLTLSFADARRHVEARSEDLAQTRPELGHATNAICVVGRRRLTRGLFLDRRAFLTSYDPTQDTPDAAVLTRTLGAVFPVCGGINLEYFFSRVDSAGYGAGTKLPHNVTALLGVMDGAASDLRTGLPWQMVEIHEPVRLLIVCETTAETMLGVMDRNPVIGGMARQGWVQLAVLHPETGEVKVFRDSEFREYGPQADELPRAASSADWYRGWRDHLEFAVIGSR